MAILIFIGYMLFLLMNICDILSTVFLCKKQREDKPHCIKSSDTTLKNKGDYLCSFLHESIKFQLDTKAPNIIKKNINGKLDKVYVAKLIQATCPFCHSSNLKYSGHYTSNVCFITTDANHPVISKQRILCNNGFKRSMTLSTLVNKYCHI